MFVLSIYIVPTKEYEIWRAGGTVPLSSVESDVIAQEGRGPEG